MNSNAIYVGSWIIAKARKQAVTVGYLQAARNLRKQGISLSLARVILLGE